MQVYLTQEKCHCKLIDFYENVAIIGGINYNENSIFDCRKLLITKMVQSEIWSYYHEQGWCDEEIAMTLAQYGPKALLEADKTTPYLVEVQDGFVNEFPRG